MMRHSHEPQVMEPKLLGPLQYALWVGGPQGTLCYLWKCLCLPVGEPQSESSTILRNMTAKGTFNKVFWACKTPLGLSFEIISPHWLNHTQQDAESPCPPRLPQPPGTPVSNPINKVWTSSEVQERPLDFVHNSWVCMELTLFLAPCSEDVEEEKDTGEKVRQVGLSSVSSRFDGLSGKPRCLQFCSF